MSVSFQLKVDAGNHDRQYCPVSFALMKNAAILSDRKIEQLSMKDENGKEIQVQWHEDGNY